jgi:hypothetical protein
MNDFSQLLNMHVCEPSTCEVELAIEKLKSHKSQGIYQIPAELIKASNKQLQTADSLWSSSLGVGRGANNSFP